MAISEGVLAGMRELGFLNAEDDCTDLGKEATAALVERLGDRHGPAFEPIKRAAGAVVPVECVLVEEGQVLLAWREHPIFGKGWHTAGTYPNSAKGETLEAAVKRCAKTELGVEVEPVRQLATLDHFDNPRFPDVPVLYRCKMIASYSEYEEGLKSGKLRWFTKCPPDMLKVQEDYRPHIDRAIKTSRRLTRSWDAKAAWEKQAEVTTFSEGELEIYLELAEKLGWRRTGTVAFESLFPILPFVPSEQAVVREVHGAREVLMWHRSDSHYTGWHLPGGYLLRGESSEDWVRRVLKKETGLELRSFFELRTFNTRPETGWVPNHQMAHFFLCRVEGEPSVGKFFPLTELPEDTLGHHKKYIEWLRAYFIRMKVMQTRGIRCDHKFRATERSWRVIGGEGHPRAVQFDEQYEDLDAALRALRAMPPDAYLIDDQGLQIL